jgi:hypothetical protein
MVNLVKFPPKNILPYSPELIKSIGDGTVKGLLPDVYYKGLQLGCKIYGKYLVKFPLAPLPRWYGNTICSYVDRPLPPPPAPPFIGGRCIGVSYRIFCRVELKDDTGEITISEASMNAIGAISQIVVATPESGADRRPYLYIQDNEPIEPRGTVLAIYGNPYVSARLISASVTRRDGQPDNCGNPPAPPLVDVDIDPNDFNQIITINNYNFEGDLTDTKDFNVVIPTVNIKPTFEFDFNLGGIDFHIDMGGLSIKGGETDIDLGGLTANINNGLGDIKNSLDIDLGDIKNSLDIDLGDIKNSLDIELPDIKNTLDIELGDIKNSLDIKLGDIKNTLDVDVKPSLEDIEDITNNIEEIVEDLKNNPDSSKLVCKYKRRPFSRSNYLPEDVEESEESVEEEEKERPDIEWVLLEITKYPPGGKTMLMQSSEDNTYFAGYFSWILNNSVDNYRLEEIPIRKEKMAFRNPGDVQGYRFYTVNKAKIKSTIYYQPKTEES